MGEGMRKVGAIVAVLVLVGCSSATEDAVRAHLIDPDSAQFREISKCSADTSITSGEVNGKNRMGAYAGFEPFFVQGGRVYFASSDEFLTVMNRCYLGSSKDGIGGSNASENLGWVTNTNINPVDDTKTVTAVLNADEGQSRFDGPVSLVVRCQSNRTDLFARWRDYLGDDSNSVYEEWKWVTVRVGSNPASREKWSLSTDNEATFAPGSPIGLLKRLADEDRLVLQTTPYNESPVTAVFDMTGFREAVAPVAEECGWEF